jgi:hypothetical protein
MLVEIIHTMFIESVVYSWTVAVQIQAEFGLLVLQLQTRRTVL